MDSTGYVRCGVEYIRGLFPREVLACDQSEGHVGPHIDLRSTLPPERVAKIDEDVRRSLADRRSGIDNFVRREDLKRKTGDGDGLQLD